MSMRPAFLLTVLPRPQLTAATMVSSSGTSAAPSSRSSAMTTMPPKATNAPTIRAAPGLSPKNEEGQKDREKHLQLDDQRAQPHRHAQLHGDEQNAELADADREAVADEQPPVDLRALDEKDCRNCGNEVAQRREQQRRHFVDTQADGNEARRPTLWQWQEPAGCRGRPCFRYFRLRRLALDQFALDQRFEDLHRVERSALAEVVRNHPHREAVLDGRILTDAATRRCRTRPPPRSASRSRRPRACR